MKKLMYLLMLSCKKATELIEKKSLTGHLSFKEKVQLRMHKGMCDACTAYEKQSKKIDDLLHHHIHAADAEHNAPMQNNALKEKIINNLS